MNLIFRLGNFMFMVKKYINKCASERNMKKNMLYFQDIISHPNKNPQYFQGVLQLRNPNEELINFIRNQFNNNSRAWIAKEESLKTGIDLYISSNKFLLALGKKLKKSFKGELKVSARLHTKNRLTSKDVYRVTVLFRLS